MFESLSITLSVISVTVFGEVQAGGGTAVLTSSSDDEEFHSISFPPDDGAQKVNN